MNPIMRRKRVLLISGAAILLCVTIIVGATYALFTESFNSINHLQAGNLDVTLVRTKLETCSLDEDGYLPKNPTTTTERTSFTEANADNLFGIDGTTRIVPGSYFDATMEIGNGGNVAFTYGIKIQMDKIQMDGENNELAKQILVTITHFDGTQKTMWLSELGEGYSIAVGEMKPTDNVQSFGVKISFEDDKDQSWVNNVAKGMSTGFDLIVTATQATK